MNKKILFFLLITCLCTSLSSYADYKATFLESSQVWDSTIADYNNDGHDDILINGHDSNDRIWYWTKSGYVPSVQVFPYNSEHFDRHACDAADVNQDGLLDLYCTQGAEKGIASKKNELYLQQANGFFALQQKTYGAEDQYGRGRRVLFLDFNHDHYPDLFVTNLSEPRSDGQINANRLFVNITNKQTKMIFSPTPTQATGAHGSYCLAKGDLNQDGWDDLVVCDLTGIGHIYLNNKQGNFTSALSSLFRGNLYWQDAKIKDVNNDGLADLIILTQSGLLQVYLNKGKGVAFDTINFKDSFAFKPMSIAIGDFNHDGHQDFYVVLRDKNCVTTLHDNAPDVLYIATGNTWKKRQLKQNYAGCGYLADVVDGDKILLMNGTIDGIGPNYLIAKQ